MKKISYISFALAILLSGCDELFYMGITKKQENYAANPGIRMAFRTVRALKRVQKFAGKDCELLGIYAYCVESDGTINFKADYPIKPEIFYNFIRPNPALPPKMQHTNEVIGDLKIGTGRTSKPPPAVAHYYPYKNIVIHIEYKRSGGSTLNNDEMTRRVKLVNNKAGTVIPSPKYSFTDVWKRAINEGAPKNAVADIFYLVKGYQFTISEKRLRYSEQGYLIETMKDTIFSMLLDMDLNLVTKNKYTKQLQLLDIDKTKF